MDTTEELELFVPGRLCILGEHSDWAGEYRKTNGSIPYGMAVVCATVEGLFARCSHHAANMLLFCHGDDETALTLDIALDRDKLSQEAQKNSFFSYIAGTMLAILDVPKYKTLLCSHGLRIHNYLTTLPMRKGLSSSAAVCVLVVQCFDAVFHCGMDTSEVMELAYIGEMNTPSRCGRMDQCVSMGPNRVGLMEFNGHHCFLHKLHCQRPLYFVVADLRASKDTIKILGSLNSCFPYPTSEEQYSMHQYNMDNQVLCWRAVNAIESGDLSALAETITRAQQLFDKCAVQHCPSELTAPVLRRTLENTTLRSLTLAGKGVGSQGDGSIQLLCSSSEQQQQVVDLLQSSDFGFDAFSLTIPASDTIDSPESILVGDTRVDRAVLLCSPLSAADSQAEKSCRAVSRLLKELVACGVRQILMVCRNITASGVSCVTCEKLRAQLTTPRGSECASTEPSGWSYDLELDRALASLVTFGADTNEGALRELFMSSRFLQNTDNRRHLNILVASFILITESENSVPLDSEMATSHPFHLVYDCLRRRSLSSGCQDASSSIGTGDGDVFGATSLVLGGELQLHTRRVIITDREEEEGWAVLEAACKKA